MRSAVVSVVASLGVAVVSAISLAGFLVWGDETFLLAGMTVALAVGFVEKYMVRWGRPRSPLMNDVIETPEGCFVVRSLNENEFGFMYVDASPLGEWLAATVMVDAKRTLGKALVEAGWQPPAYEGHRFFRLKGGSKW